ncbi:MAG TPA: hypothetical protein VFY83_12675 [Anaerolineales bacterium]|nr:hypothetical protein [Anaerolineales bacterium]
MNKRYIPLIVLSLVSLFVFACALVVVWVLSVDAKTINEKIQASLTLGIPSALALIVLLWFGAGMDHALARLKTRSTRIGVSLLTYIVVPIVLCIGLPALVAVIIYAGFNAPKGWQQLPAPPEPAVQIAGAGELHVIIRTDAGSYYYCAVSSPSTCWESTTEPEQRLTGRGIEITTPPSSEPPKGVISILGLSYTDMGVEGQVHYAVLEDGSVWYLQKDENKYEAGFASGLFLMLAIIPAIAGLLVIYLGAGVSALARGVANRDSAG